METLRVGIIGVGKMAQISHLPILAKLPTVQLQAFCDTDPENLKTCGDEYGVDRCYDDHHEMFDAETLDAVCIFVPPFAHTDAEIIAAQRGVHLFVEKPPALSMQKAFEIHEAIEDAGIISAVGFNRRYAATSEVAGEMLQDTPVVQALIHRMHGSKAAADWWSIERLSGGAFVENTIHMVDLLRYLGAEYTSVSARIVERPDSTDTLDIPLSHCATYTLAGGGAANITTCTALEHMGSAQFLVAANGSLYDIRGGELFVDGESVAKDAPDRADYRAEFATFFDAVLENDPGRVRSPYGDAIRSLAAVLGAVESARSGGAEVDLTSSPYALPEER
ncbi:MAG: Gfo/Idh/MocA family oxidoreductase [Armatimonadota bacterium]